MTERYRGQPLGPRPRIALLGAAKLGNFVAATPLLRGLKTRFPDATVDYYGAPVTRDFEAACPWVDWRTDIYPLSAGVLASLADAVRERWGGGEGYALAVNLDGFNAWTATLAGLLGPRYAAGRVLAPGGGGEPLPPGDHPLHRIEEEEDWTSPAFLERHREHLTSNYIGELLARIAFVETDYFTLSLESAAPRVPVPDVLVHANANRDAKLWPASSWTEVLEWCRQAGLGVGLVGVRPRPGEEEARAGFRIEAALAAHPGVADLRGRTPPLELAGALRRARALVTVDSGPLHVAAAVGCPTVAVFGNDRDGVGASPLELWLPRAGHVLRTVSEHRCTLCLENRFRNDGCLLPRHECMAGVAP
ncbi:MAG: glycosyltransferase family 9 protein, partial [Longimicrobiales bacterium]|nr:glycosyltransferase family 9 protein [Longimicrobiales bacterium]